MNADMQSRLTRRSCRFGAGAGFASQRFGDFAISAKYSQKFAVNGVYQRYSPSFCGEGNISVGENLPAPPKFFENRNISGIGKAGQG